MDVTNMLQCYVALEIKCKNKDNIRKNAEKFLENVKKNGNKDVIISKKGVEIKVPVCYNGTKLLCERRYL